MKRRAWAITRSFMLVALASAVSACDLDGGGGLRSPTIVGIEPTDDSTGDGLTIGMLFFFAGAVGQMPLEVRTRIANGVRLRTEPEGEEVPLRATITEVDSQRLRMSFVPDHALTPGWHTFEVHLPTSWDGYRVAQRRLRADADEEVYATRFHQGSLPLLLADAQFDSERPGSLLVGVQATEPVFLDHGLELGNIVGVSSGGRSLSCQILEPAAVERELGNPSPAWFTCPGATSDQTLQIDVSPGLASATGVPLRDMSGGQDPATVAWIPSASEWAPAEPSDALLAVDAAAVP